MSEIPQVVYAGRAELAEGPVWHEAALWWVDIVAGTLNRLDVASGANTARATGPFLGSATPCTDGRWLLGKQHGCAILDWETGRMNPFAVPPAGHTNRHRFNDGKCDPVGRFWGGTMHLDRLLERAALYVMEANGTVRRALDGISLSNGLAWSPRHDRFYHIDTPTRRVSEFHFDADTGEIDDRKVLIEFSERDGFPDGMTIDAEGHLWIALWGGSSVVRVDGRAGIILERHRLPVTQVSSCTFGGPDLSILFITTAWEGFSFAQREAEPLAGSIFALRTQTRGLPVVPFRIQ